MIRIIILLFASVFCFDISAQEVKTMNLKAALEYAAEHDRSIKNARLNIDDANQQIIERRATGLPKVNGLVEYQYYFQVPVSVLPQQIEDVIRIGNGGTLPPGFSRQAAFAFRNNFNLGLSMNTMVFDGSYFIGLRAARLYREYASQELIAAERKLHDKVIEAYLPPLIINENIGIIDSNIRVIEDLLFGTKETYKEGFAEQLDVDRFELSLANFKIERENLVRQKEVALNVLKFTIGHPISEPLEIDDNINNLLANALEDELTSTVNYYNRPEYKVAEIGVSLNQMNVDYQKALYYPTLSGFANYQYGYQGDKLFNDNGFWAPLFLAGVRLNVPIFDGFDKRAKVARNEIALKIAQNQKADLERAINLEVENARTQYISAKQRVESQKKTMALSEKIYNTTQIKFVEGVGSSLELRQAEFDFYQSQLNHTQALYELLLAKTALERALGK